MQEPNNQTKKEHADLYKRSIKGSYWVFAIRLATQILGFIKSVIVYNFLFHQNLELVIVANLLIAILETSTQSGFQAALIQKRDNVESYLDSAWVIGILRGFLLFGLIYFIAPVFASLKVEAPENIPLAVSVIRVMGLCFLIRAFQNIGVVYFQKELEFHKTFWLTMAGTLTEIVLAIGLVVVYHSVWGYVIACVAGAFVNVGMSYLLCSFKPRFHFVPEKARELWQFGKWLFGGNIMGYFLNEGDDWFVLFYFPTPEPLKLYRFAYRFSHMPATHITNTISQVSFPAYSKIQHDLARLRAAYLKVLRITALVSIPTAFLIFALGPDFVRLFLVEGSSGMIVPLQIIAIQGLIKAEGGTRGPLFLALGQSKLNWFYQCLRLSILAVLIYPLTRIGGISGTALATLLATLLIKPLGFRRSCQLLRCSAWTLLAPSLLPFVSAVIMLLVMFFIDKSGFLLSCKVTFFIRIAIGAGVYVAALLGFDVFFKAGYWRLIREQFIR